MFRHQDQDSKWTRGSRVKLRSRVKSVCDGPKTRKVLRACSYYMFKQNYMQANPSKFQAMVLNRQGNMTNLVFNIDTATLKPNTFVKLLGVHLVITSSILTNKFDIFQQNAQNKLTQWLGYPEC